MTNIDVQDLRDMAEALKEQRRKLNKMVIDTEWGPLALFVRQAQESVRKATDELLTLHSIASNMSTASR